MKVSHLCPLALRITFTSKEQMPGTTQNAYLFSWIEHCPCNSESPLEVQNSSNGVQTGKQAALPEKEIYLPKISGLVLVSNMWLLWHAFPGVAPCAWQEASINYPSSSREGNIKYVYQIVWPSSIRRGR